MRRNGRFRASPPFGSIPCFRPSLLQGISEREVAGMGTKKPGPFPARGEGMRRAVRLDAHGFALRHSCVRHIRHAFNRHRLARVPLNQRVECHKARARTGKESRIRDKLRALTLGCVHDNGAGIEGGHLREA